MKYPFLIELQMKNWMRCRVFCYRPSAEQHQYGTVLTVVRKGKSKKRKETQPSSKCHGLVPILCFQQDKEAPNLLFNRGLAPPVTIF